MATPVTSSAWQVTFKRFSVLDQDTYLISLPDETPKAVVNAIASELRSLGYVDVDVVFAVVLP